MSAFKHVLPWSSSAPNTTYSDSLRDVRHRRAAALKACGLLEQSKIYGSASYSDLVEELPELDSNSVPEHKFGDDGKDTPFVRPSCAGTCAEEEPLLDSWADEDDMREHYCPPTAAVERFVPLPDGDDHNIFGDKTHWQLQRAATMVPQSLGDRGSRILPATSLSSPLSSPSSQSKTMPYTPIPHAHELRRRLSLEAEVECIEDAESRRLTAIAFLT